MFARARVERRRDQCSRAERLAMCAVQMSSQDY
jgi:hypothetical protein